MDFALFQPVDRISNLPDNVMDNILMRLTIRDAAKTSILAKQWLHKWHNLPQLIFDDRLWPYRERNKELARIKFVEILYQVLLRHQGPITKFSLDVPQLRVRSEIDHLIHILWKSNVEELILKPTNHEEYKLPSVVFRCLQLKELSLSYCVINPPPSFKGFNRLTRLELRGATIEAGVLVNLVSCCPLLEQLALYLENEVDHLEIVAPMLKVFDLKCETASIRFKNSPLLTKVLLGYNGGVLVGVEEVSNFVEFFNSVPALQELYMEGCIMKPLHEDEVQTKIPASFKNLKTLELSSMDLNLLEELSAFVFLMKTCSNLEHLKIEVYDSCNRDVSSRKVFLEAQDFSNVVFHHLREVILEEFDDTFVEMTLVKLLLEKSPALKRVVISACSCLSNETLKEFNKFRRASPKVEVICLDSQLVSYS